MNRREIVEMEISNFILYYCGDYDKEKERMEGALKDFMSEVFE